MFWMNEWLRTIWASHLNLGTIFLNYFQTTTLPGLQLIVFLSLTMNTTHTRIHTQTHTESKQGGSEGRRVIISEHGAMLTLWPNGCLSPHKHNNNHWHTALSSHTLYFVTFPSPLYLWSTFQRSLAISSAVSFHQGFQSVFSSTSLSITVTLRSRTPTMSLPPLSLPISAFSNQPPPPPRLLSPCACVLTWGLEWKPENQDGDTQDKREPAS